MSPEDPRDEEPDTVDAGPDATDAGPDATDAGPGVDADTEADADTDINADTGGDTEGESEAGGTVSVDDTEPSSSTETDEESDPTSISNIERIVLDPDDLVRSLAYNGQEDIGRKGKAVFSLTPPFGETVEPTIKHLEDDSTEGKADDEIHLRPFRFVVDGRQVIEQRPTRPLAKEELDQDDPSEETIEAWLDEAMVTWKDHVRENLGEAIDIFSSHGMTIVNVEYESRE